MGRYQYARDCSNGEKEPAGMIVVDRAVGAGMKITGRRNRKFRRLPRLSWETCMTMASSWSYVPGDIYKPANSIIHMLAEIVARGGFPSEHRPSPEGTWADTAYARLREIGDWMKINGKPFTIAGHKAFQISEYMLTSKPDGTIYCIYLAGSGIHARELYVEGLRLSGGPRLSFRQAR